MASPLLVNVAELLRHPGTRKPLSIAVGARDAAVDDPRVEPEAPVSVTAELESTLDGITVRGGFTVPWHDTCRRCAHPVAGEASGVLDEVFQLRPVGEDASPIVGEQIDLGPVLRDVVLLELPDGALCRPDCAGLCPVCGVDRNEEMCECSPDPVDDRWSALDQLRGDLA